MNRYWLRFSRIGVPQLVALKSCLKVVVSCHLILLRLTIDVIACATGVSLVRSKLSSSVQQRQYVSVPLVIPLLQKHRYTWLSIIKISQSQKLSITSTLRRSLKSNHKEVPSTEELQYIFMVLDTWEIEKLFATSEKILCKPDTFLIHILLAFLHHLMMDQETSNYLWSTLMIDSRPTRLTSIISMLHILLRAHSQIADRLAEALKLNWKEKPF